MAPSAIRVLVPGAGSGCGSGAGCEPATTTGVEAETLPAASAARTAYRAASTCGTFRLVPVAVPMGRSLRSTW
ncbi:hypothetical protein DEJ38_15155 [Kocuria rosea]|nr:hypothetical protein DEJ38_15155 [Kocuria rosea]